jgi:hypothetical protein
MSKIEKVEMKDISLDDLKVLVESLENNEDDIIKKPDYKTLDEDVPIKEPDYKTLVKNGVLEVQEQEDIKNLYEEIRLNKEKIAAEKERLVQEAADKEELKNKSLIKASAELLPDKKEDPLLSDKIDSLTKLQENQKLLISRLQTQLDSLGGGGETRLQYLDDIVGIATNLNAYDGMVLQVDVSGPVGKKFKFGNSGSGSGSVGVQTVGGYVGSGATTLKFIGSGVDGVTIPSAGVSTITIDSPNSTIMGMLF